MHTDFHLQVGYKYGLQRGDFSEDLSPIEKLHKRGHLSKAEYIAWKEAKKEIEKTEKELNDLIAEIKKAETRQKGLTTMLAKDVQR